MKTRRLFFKVLLLVCAAAQRAPAMWETLVPAGSVWRYHYDWEGQPAAVRTPGFDDSAWPSGPAQLGYGEQDEATVLIPYPPNKPGSYTGDKPMTAYFRLTFRPESTQAAMMRLDLLRDDGAVIWLNGEEITRSNMPGGDITPATPARRSLGDPEERTPVPIYVPNPTFTAGNNTLVVEVHQATSTSNDISFDLAVHVCFCEPGDSDSDGLPDWWEWEKLSALTWAGGMDPDNDGATNAEEFGAGTDPLVRDSRTAFQVSTNSPVSLILSWSQQNGMYYSVEESANLTHWQSVQSLAATFTGTGLWIVPAAPGPAASNRFYRLRMSRWPLPQE